MERVVITGIGLITPCGLTTDETWRSLLDGASGIRRVTQFDPDGFPVAIAGEVPGFDPDAHLTRVKRKETARFSQLSIVASRAAVADAGLELDDETRQRCGTVIGVGLGGLEEIDKYSQVLRERGARKVSPYFIPQVIANLAAGQVAIDQGLQGPSYCTTSACASSAHAIGDAADQIRLGRTDVMLAGGAESTITKLGLAGFATMFALSRRNDAPEAASRPWDEGRDGFVMGEGAATLVLESLSRARGRGARIYAEVAGYGASCDAFHITKPDPEGTGARRAMEMALRDAAVATDAVGYVNAHATSTPAGDTQEAKAIEALFGDHATRSGGLWVSSTKGATGHLLGGAGALEAAVSALVVARGAVPPTLNLHALDPEVRLDCVPLEARERAVDHALSNSFGFGGTNAALVLSRV
ncbi:MAG: beta-ketoacyl-ACP synthase II [Myxococcota bacterium]